MSDPGYFRSETLKMILLLLENIFGDEHGKRAILYANSIDFRIEPSGDLFPDGEGVGLITISNRPVSGQGSSHLVDIAPRDVVVINHVPFRQHLRVPRGEVILFRDVNANQRRALHLFFRRRVGSLLSTRSTSFLYCIRRRLVGFFFCQLLLLGRLFESVL